MHPLAPNLKNMTDQEIMDKLNEIHRKLAQSRGNYHLMNQVQMMLQIYQEEFNKRMAEREKEALEELGDDFYSDKINVS